MINPAESVEGGEEETQGEPREREQERIQRVLRVGTGEKEAKPGGEDRPAENRRQGVWGKGSL